MDRGLLEGSDCSGIFLCWMLSETELPWAPLQRLFLKLASLDQGWDIDPAFLNIGVCLNSQRCFESANLICCFI